MVVPMVLIMMMVEYVLHGDKICDGGNGDKDKWC